MPKTSSAAGRAVHTFFFSMLYYFVLRAVDKRIAMVILRHGVFISFFISIILLMVQVLLTFSFGRRRPHSEPEGNRWKGVAYAFGRGMLPWEKESAARHLPTYIAGMLYHGGIFAAILTVLSVAAAIPVSELILLFLRVLMAVGFLAGMGLLLKRAVKPQMRHISCPDDFAANVLVDLFVLTGLFASRLNGAVPIFLIIAIVVFLYMPLGKIRHCFFFFYSRFLFGTYFGRRGVLPRRRPAKA